MSYPNTTARRRRAAGFRRALGLTCLIAIVGCSAAPAVRACGPCPGPAALDLTGLVDARTGDPGTGVESVTVCIGRTCHSQPAVYAVPSGRPGYVPLWYVHPGEDIKGLTVIVTRQTTVLRRASADGSIAVPRSTNTADCACYQTIIRYSPSTGRLYRS